MTQPRTFSGSGLAETISEALDLPLEALPPVLAMELVRISRRLAATPFSSVSFGPPDGGYLVLVALTKARALEVETVIAQLRGAGPDPVGRALRAEVLCLQARVAELEQQVAAAAKCSEII